MWLSPSGQVAHTTLDWRLCRTRIFIYYSNNVLQIYYTTTRVKSYVMGRKNFLFHNTVDGARASATVLSLIETAKANNLNIYQYLYTLLLYMPDYKDAPAGIEQLMPWSDFIKEKCSGVTNTSTEKPESRGNLSI